MEERASRNKARADKDNSNEYESDGVAALNSPHPSLVHSVEVPNTFLKITADTTQSPARLTAEFINHDGKRLFNTVELSAEELIL